MKCPVGRRHSNSKKVCAHALWVLPYLSLLILGGCSLSGDGSIRKLPGGFNLTHEKRLKVSVTSPFMVYLQDFTLMERPLKKDCLSAVICLLGLLISFFDRFRPG